MGRDAARTPATGGAAEAVRPGSARAVRPPGRRLAAASAAALALALLLAACGAAEEGATQAGDDRAASETADDQGDGAAPGYGALDKDSGKAEPVQKAESAEGEDDALSEHRIAKPGPLPPGLLGDDMLVYSQETLPDGAARTIANMKGVVAVEAMSISNVTVEAQVLTVAAVNPASYRRHTPRTSAQLPEIWNRVAGGEMAISPRLGKRLQDEDGYVTLGNDEGAPEVHIGAYADQVRQIDAVVNPTWADDLGMTEGNALVVSTLRTAPQEVRGPIQKLLRGKASVQILGPDLDTSVQQTAILTGGSVAKAVGTFGYTVLGGGRVQPDPSWEDANIRTEEVPILGDVTCHRVMLTQLRAALTEVVTRGLAAEINPDEYAGCYYPRFIAGSSSLSNHSFGIAVDLNVPGNQRGTVGEIDRTVVSIFKKWGFAWGGDWSYTDPMHFELARLVDAG